MFWFRFIGPGRTGQIFVYFIAKNSVTSSLRQVRPVIFRSSKFFQGLPNFKDAVVLSQSRTNYLVSGVKSDKFVSSSISIRTEPAKIIWYLRGVEDPYLGMLHYDPYSDYNYCGSQVYVPAESSKPSTVQFVHPYANRPNTHSYASHPSQSSACTSYITTDQIESSQVEDSRADESRKFKEEKN